MNANPQPTTFYGVTTDQNWTHINLLNRRPGYLVDSNNGHVTMQDNTGRLEIFEQDKLHLTWAPLARDSQGDKA